MTSVTPYSSPLISLISVDNLISILLDELTCLISEGSPASSLSLTIKVTLLAKLERYSDSCYRSAREFSNRYKDTEFIPEKRTQILAIKFYDEVLKLEI